MSRSSLEAFLLDLEKDLSNTSDAYRRQTADMRTNHFVFLPHLFEEEIKKEVKDQEPKLNDSIEVYDTKDKKEMLKELKERIKKK